MSSLTSSIKERKCCLLISDSWHSVDPCCRIPQFTSEERRKSTTDSWMGGASAVMHILWTHSAAGHAANHASSFRSVSALLPSPSFVMRIKTNPVMSNVPLTADLFFLSSCRQCGYPQESLTFLSSGNVMLLTLVTNQEKNFPGFRAFYSQVPLDSGGELLWTAAHRSSLWAQTFRWC